MNNKKSICGANASADFMANTSGSAKKRRFTPAFLAQAAIIAALYASLTVAQQLILPGSASLSVQFRVAEALMLLCVFMPGAIPGVTIGCFIANLTSSGALPVDMVLGTLATLLSGICMYHLRHKCIKGYPVLAALMPAVFNGVIIGLELEVFYIEGAFHFGSFLVQAALVAAGELGVCLLLGLPFARLMQSRVLPRIKQ